MKEAGSQLERLWRVAESLNPKGVLRRGYALVTDTSGHVVTSAAGARAARRVSLQFADGGVDATIGSDESAPRAPSPKKAAPASRSAEHTSELQSLMRTSYAVFCLKKKTTT